MSGDYAVVLHGLARTRRSMGKLAGRLEAAGYVVVNIDYPSRKAPIEELAERYLAPAVAARCADRRRRVHFVTHSLGGILTRCYLAAASAAHPEVLTTLPEGNPLGHVVMLAPPNQGSEIVDWLRTLAIYRKVMGPAGLQLGTDPESVPSRLNEHGPVNYPVGIIAGERSVNPILASRIPGPNDGKVSLERARVPGMADFIAVPRSHTFIMVADDVIEQVLHFLEHGRFARASLESAE